MTYFEASELYQGGIGLFQEGDCCSSLISRVLMIGFGPEQLPLLVISKPCRFS